MRAIRNEHRPVRRTPRLFRSEPHEVRKVRAEGIPAPQHLSHLRQERGTRKSQGVQGTTGGSTKDSDGAVRLDGGGVYCYFWEELY